MTVSKEDLLKARFGVEEFEIAGVGTVKIRPLSRSQALELRGKEMPIEEMERKLVAGAMVEPAMTEDDVRLWQDASPAGELEPLTDAIVKLSGMLKDSPKEAVHTFRE